MPAGVKIVGPATPPKPPPPPRGEIKLSAPRDPGPVEPAKPGTARERLSQSLYKKAGVVATPEPPKPAATDNPEPEIKPPGQQPADDLNAPPPEPDPEDPTAQPAAAQPAQPAAGEKPKTNPWKVVEQWKSKAGELEKQLAEAKTASLPEQEKKTFLTRIEELQKRNTELEDEMRFVNYSKSEEFKNKFDAPYRKAFDTAVQEMSELTITDPQTGAVRNVTANDISTLASLGLADARKLANELYGDFADDMMDHRKEIRNLYRQRQEALEEQRTKGAEREKQREEMSRKTNTEIQDFIKSTWHTVNEAATKHETYGKYFTPIEGDQDGNQRLAKGYELVDRAFSENPNDPKLTSEERAAIVKRHAAVRNRAAAAGRLIAWVNQRDAKIAELEKELSQYRKTTPQTGGSPQGGQAAPAEGQRASSRVFGDLRKLAH